MIARRSTRAWLTLVALGLLATACLKTTWVVVPRPANGYRRTDTLLAYSNGKQVVVSFRFDTITHTRTLYRTDTIYRDGVKIVRDTVLRIRHDTVRIVRRDTVRERVGGGPGGFRVDTVRVTVGGGPGGFRVDTVRVAVHDTVNVVQRDSIVVTRTVLRVDTLRHVDTVFVASTSTAGQRVDTVRIVRTDTVRLAGKRVLFVPPGQYPPEGQCRVWIADKPPGQQRDAERCDAISNVPSGAFILFGGDAWDFDYDWVAEQQRTGGVPAQIVALKRRKP